MTDNNIELVKLARGGNRDALEELLKSIQDYIYRFALRVLYKPQDAEDATQEILIKIITKLDRFRLESSFSTWAFKITANHLKNRKQNQKENWFTFKRCENQILKELPDQSTVRHFEAEQQMVVEEMRLACMQGMIQCLDYDHRLAYVLGVTMDLSGPEGAAILDITPSAFRKRLSRARGILRDFLSRNCDLFDDGNPCHCASQAMLAVEKGRIKPTELQFVKHRISEEKIHDIKAQLNLCKTMERDVALMRINQNYEAPETFIAGIKKMLDTGRLESPLLND